MRCAADDDVSSAVSTLATESRRTLILPSYTSKQCRQLPALLHFTRSPAHLRPLLERNSKRRQSIALLLNVVDRDGDVPESTPGLGVAVAVALEFRIRLGACTNKKQVSKREATEAARPRSGTRRDATFATPRRWLHGNIRPTPVVTKLKNALPSELGVLLLLRREILSLDGEGEEVVGEVSAGRLVDWRTGVS
jgi:hypothetical protein